MTPAKPGRKRRELDEDDIRVRPSKGSRPRTRDRPAYADAKIAMVIAVDRGRYTCYLDHRPVVAIRGGDTRRTAVVVGDQVDLVGDVTGATDALCRIVRIHERASILQRTPDDTEGTEKPIVANADLLVVVTALTRPAPSSRMIDRCLVAAYDGGLTPVLCLTKGDLADPKELTAAYSPLGVDVVTTRRQDGVVYAEELAALVKGKISVFFGSSGVGKSTLVNHLVPDAFRATGAVSGLTGKGRHTSSSAVALELADGGWVIDTAGIRSFGLGAVSLERVLRAFPDLAEAAEDCLPNCSHAESEPDCRLTQAITDKGASPERISSFRRLLSSRLGDEEQPPDTREFTQ